MLSLPRADCNAGLVTLMHRFERYAFGWDAQHRHQIDGLLDMGIDGVFSDHVDRLADALAGRPDLGPGGATAG